MLPYVHEKARHKIDCYILYAVLLVIILVLKIVVFFYHCVKHSSKQKKTYWCTNNVKMENSEFKKTLFRSDN